jgi:3-oxoacyl-[acyl-carrier-protein] synthase II
MNTISVAGLGMVSKIGDIGDLQQLLMGSGLISPNRLQSSHSLVLDIPDALNFSSQLLRRMSHFAKLALLSADKALRDSGLDITGKSVGIIQGSVYGPIISGIQAFDELIDFGDNQLSPTNFSGSVFNTSAAYLSLAFGIQGCTLSHTCGMDTLYNSLLTASLWLQNGAADYVVLGVGDEYTAYFDQNSFSCHQASGLLPTCEGWTTFILSNTENPQYGKIEYSSLQTLPEIQNQKNIYSVWHHEIKNEPFLDHAQNNQACFPVSLRGSYPSASAYDLALALICARTKRFPIYQASSGEYSIQDVYPGEKISCYSLAENKSIFCYEILNS